MPERQQEQYNDGEHHFEVGQWGEANCAHGCQLDELEEGKQMHFALRHAADIVVRRVGRLHTHDFIPFHVYTMLQATHSLQGAMSLL